MPQENGVKLGSCPQVLRVWDQQENLDPNILGVSKFHTVSHVRTNILFSCNCPIYVLKCNFSTSLVYNG